MINTALKTENFYTVKETSDIIKRSITSVKNYCKEGKLDAIKVVDNGGEQYRISYSAIIEYADKNNITLPSINLSPQMTESIQEQGFAFLNTSPTLKHSPVPFSFLQRNSIAQVIPEKAKEIGLARQDLLKAWSDFRDNSEKKTQADNDFITLYNAKMICSELHHKLGKVSKGTLYRWKKAFEESGNYMTLIPNYNYQAHTQKQTKLSEIETKYLLDLLLQPSKVSIGNATRLVKYVLKKQGIRTASDITYRRFANWFKDQYYDTWVLMREGQKALVDKVAPYVERNPSLLEVGDVLVADGHVLDFQVINPFNGKPCRATLVGYLDWKSTALAGYEIMLTENTQNICSALL
ncbi:MAG: helix-turn-helix domain-containing protein [Candidatus Gastranaerophilales bacterium]|nr:helix-turn-helix domain-containing protein [Candidatus Gastranaerophilales bacterium]